jgi:hypothetical protein
VNNTLLTSAHNVVKASKSWVYNGSKLFEVEVINVNKRVDVAILKLTDDMYLPSLSFRNTNVTLGEQVFVVGTLENQAFYTCNAGIIRKEKYMNNNIFQSILTNVEIQKGMSGSPILDSEGCVVGIISWFVNWTTSGGADSFTLKRFINSINDTGWLPILTRPLKIHEILHYNMPTIEELSGELVCETNCRSKIMKNDLIISVNGMKVGMSSNSSEWICFNFLHRKEVANVVLKRYIGDDKWSSSFEMVSVVLSDYIDKWDVPIRSGSEIKIL